MILLLHTVPWGDLKYYGRKFLTSSQICPTSGGASRTIADGLGTCSENRGNEKLPINGGFNGKIVYKYYTWICFFYSNPFHPFLEYSTAVAKRFRKASQFHWILPTSISLLGCQKHYTATLAVQGGRRHRGLAKSVTRRGGDPQS